MPATKTDKWFSDFGNVLALAEYLEDEGELSTVRATIRFFEKPWKWETEWLDYQRSIRPDTATEF